VLVWCHLLYLLSLALIRQVRCDPSLPLLSQSVMILQNLLPLCIDWSDFVRNTTKGQMLWKKTRIVRQMQDIQCEHSEWVKIPDILFIKTHLSQHIFAASRDIFLRKWWQQIFYSCPSLLCVEYMETCKNIRMKQSLYRLHSVLFLICMSCTHSHSALTSVISWLGRWLFKKWCVKAYAGSLTHVLK
jgi:hypothetical protein